MTIAAFAAAFVIAARASNFSDKSVDEPLVFPLGQWVEVDATRTYQFEIAAGMAVELKVGRRLTPTDVFVFGPEDAGLAGKPTAELPASGNDAYAVHTLPGSDHVEYAAVVSKGGGTFHLQVNIRPVGKTLIFLGKPHPATAKDNAAAEAARIMFDIGATRRGKRSPESVVESSKRRVELHRLLEDPESLAWVLNQHAAVMEGAVRLIDALPARLEARSIYLQKNDLVMAVNFSPCYVYEALGDIQAWIHCFHEDLSLARRSGSKMKEAETLRSVGFTYHKLADEVQATDYYLQSLTAWRALIAAGEASGANEVMLLRDLGSLNRGTIQLGRPIDFFPERTREDLERSLAYYREALELDRKYKTGFRPHLLHQIGVVYREMGMYAEASDHLSQSIAAYGSGTASIALVTLDVARLHIDKGEAAAGTKLVDAVLPELRRRGISLERIASVYLDAGEVESARRLYGEMLAESRRVRKLSDVCVALFGLSRVERKLGNFNNARIHIIEAIQIADSLRNRITDDDVRSTYFAAVKKYYDFYIDLLMQAHRAQPERGFERTALQISEKARSRNLLDMLMRSGVDIHAGVDPKLIEEEKIVKARLAEKATAQTRLLSQKHDPGEAAAVNAAVNELAIQHKAVEARIREASPRYAALTQPAFATVDEMQQLLDRETVLLEYALGDEKSYLWVVSVDSVASFELPPRKDIKRLVNESYTSITGLNTVPKRGEASGSDDAYAIQSKKLSDTLLAPAAELIRNKRLVIVPDGPLNYVSFGSLPVPGKDPRTPLVAEHEVVLHPSASALAFMRSETQSEKAPDLVAIFADPIFSATDVRIQRNGGRSGVVGHRKEKTGQTRDFILALENGGLGADLPRLPFSRREADSIFKSASGRRSIKNVDFEASKEKVFSSNLERYRIVHFASHGLIDGRNPALSGIVLSLVEKEGSEIDGFLRLQDIYNLKLNADLVVLSACRTALGKEVRGEGIVGMARGFMYAGAPRVVVSLWKVDDAATAYLMSAFYRRMLVDNMRPAAALRAAQNEMKKQKRWRSPYYWAPFVLQGEWK